MNVYQCSKCGTEFSQGAKFCQKCGCNLELDFIENPVCPKCLKNFPTGTKFCDVDGAKLISPEKLIPRCVKCGKTYPAGIKFCPDDGGAVISEAFQQGETLSLKRKFNGKYPKAALGKRFVATLLDGLITTGLAIPAIIFFILGIVELNSGYYDYYYNYYHDTTEEAIPLFIIALFLYFVPLAYSFIKDGLFKGQSLGKKSVRLMVVYLPNNTPCTIGKSCLRGLISSLLGSIPFVGWLIEPIIVLATRDGRRLADRTAKTQVIDKDLFHN